MDDVLVGLVVTLLLIVLACGVVVAAIAPDPAPLLHEHPVVTVALSSLFRSS